MEMDTNNNIVVVGSCMVDFVSYAPRLPTSGETIHGTKFVTNFGGKGANQCVAAARLGGQTTLIARLGDDTWGPKYLENLLNERVNVLYVRNTHNTTTGIAQITVADSGENQIVIVPGANYFLDVSDIVRAANVVRTAKVLVVQLETKAEVAIKAMEVCNGVKILNGAPGLAEYDEELLKLPTIFCVNETEAAIFSGLPVNGKSDAEEAAKTLISRGCNSVILTLGSEGAIYVHKQNARQATYVKCPKVNCVDSTGAGDAFIGALAYFLANHDQLPMPKIIEKACFLASFSVTKEGTQISFPCADILRKMPVNSK